MIKSHLLAVVGLAFISINAHSASMEKNVSSASASDSTSSTIVTGYNKPPQKILQAMHAPNTPSMSINSPKTKMLMYTVEDYPSIQRVARPFLKLAGIRLEPDNRGRHDTPGGYGIPKCLNTLSVMDLKTQALKTFEIKKLSCSTTPVWNNSGDLFYVRNTSPKSVELWIGDSNTGKLTRVEDVALNPMLGSTVQWMPDNRNVLVKLVPTKQGPPPKKEESSISPSIQESTGQTGQSSTYERRDTLNNPHDEKLFEYYGLSQMAMVDTKTSKVTKIGKPGLYDDLMVSPDGHFMLVSTIARPFSYIVTASRFPKVIDIVNITKLAQLKFTRIAELPLADRVPIHGEPLGPREHSWHAHDPATLIWAEALDGGDWAVNVPHRDKIMKLSAPFTESPQELFRTVQRYNGLSWFETRENAVLSEYDENKHWFKTFLVNPDQPQQAPKLLFDLSTEDSYASPGAFVRQYSKTGTAVIRQNGDFVYLSGPGATPTGDRPFLDKFNFRTLKRERLFRTELDAFESFVSFTGQDEQTFYTLRQSPLDPPNLFMRTLAGKKEALAGEAIHLSTKKQVTQNTDPTPELRKIKKQIVKYKRADGMELSFTLYTPPDYMSGKRVPTILYAYPLDYADASKAGQVRGTELNFTRLRNYRLLLLAGYAIIDDAAFPIVGDPKKAYDTYLQQLIANATAAVNKAVEMGVADPERIGVTGHSHGALMTVNLLAHSKLFKAGVATSGSYNKMITPFGFQNERRTVWEAPDVYKTVSPYFFADKIKTPLLIVHGSDDANPGTTPMQANLLYEAVRGNGGKTRLVMLPHEPHWYTARESNEQLVYEMLRWFDLYVKGEAKK